LTEYSNRKNDMQRKTTAEVLDETLKVLREGGVILYPTDTVWGLGCDAANPAAVAKIYEIKKRADSKSLVLLATSLDQIALYVKEIPPMAIDLVEVNDRPMTIIYPCAKTYPSPAEGEAPKADRFHLAHNTVAADGSVGIRVPLMEFCRQLTYKLGRPIVSTSANISGEKTPKNYKEISPEIISAVDYVVDPRLEAESTGVSSQIIKVGMGGEIEIIRP
jgi:Sua5/YciO/YrdC/YwlC family protein